MIVWTTSLSDSLCRSLALCHDQGEPALVVSAYGAHVMVRRFDGSEPSFTEQHEVTMRAAAVASDADLTPTVRLRVAQVGDELVVSAVG